MLRPIEANNELSVDIEQLFLLEHTPGVAQTLPLEEVDPILKKAIVVERFLRSFENRFMIIKRVVVSEISTGSFGLFSVFISATLPFDLDIPLESIVTSLFLRKWTLCVDTKNTGTSFVVRKRSEFEAESYFLLIANVKTQICGIISSTWEGEFFNFDCFSHMAKAIRCLQQNNKKLQDLSVHHIGVKEIFNFKITFAD